MCRHFKNEFYLLLILFRVNTIDIIHFSKSDGLFPTCVLGTLANHIVHVSETLDEVQQQNNFFPS